MKTIPLPVLVVLLAAILVLMFLKRPLLAIVIDSAIIGGLIVGPIWGMRGVLAGAVFCGAIAGFLAYRFL